MKREFFKLVFIIAALVSLACTNETTSANKTLPSPNSEAQNPSKSSSDFDAKNQSEINFKTKQKPFFVILGVVVMEDGKIEPEGDFWGHDWDEKTSEFYPDDKVEVDLMNCAGYLASGTTNYKKVAREVKIMPETIASDAVQKIRQCSDSPNNEIVSSPVFGISPRVSERKSIKIGKVNTKELYNQLIKDLKETDAKEKRAESTGKIQIPQKDKKPLIGEPKNGLSLRDDIWTDIDGDGRIDLINFHESPCAEAQTCSSIYQLIDGKWKEIEYILPL